MNIAITWHRKNALLSYLKENKIKYNDFINASEDFLISNFDKDKDLFFVGGSDWFDNIFTDLLIKHWYKYNLKLSEKDKEWRQNRNKDDFDLFNRISENALSIQYVDWSYIKRDYELIKEADRLIMFITPWKIWKSWTWTTFELFFKKNIWKEIIIKNINNKFFFMKDIYII